ncbi:MAG: hypothetical protein JWO86_2661 [Myxococcaceae bacterium]|nr:hypothetical protein [Myxococcaceae bacterium]
MRLNQRLETLAFTVVIAAASACGNTGDPIATPPAAPAPAAPAGTGAADPVVTPPSSMTPAATPPATTAQPPVAPAAPLTASSCFASLKGAVPGPDYDKSKPVIVPSCSGTHHQTITGVQKVVFLGDSVTTGTPPTLPGQIYRDRVTAGAKTRFGNNIAVADCSAWGADTEDFLANKNQLTTCFPGASEPKRTLIVMTMGGNDIASWARAKLSTADAMVQVDAAADRLRAAIDWLQAPGRFPNGVFVTFANVYEYTDTSGDLGSCPTAQLASMSGTWPTGVPAIVHLQERYLQIATETKTDMIFLLEHFCGHGYKRDDPTLQCYRGPGAELWFDLTCIHPSPKGHEQIANLFLDVIDGT